VKPARLSFWSALPAYIGGKRRLAPLILREIDKLVPRAQWHGCRFLDGFAGACSVSLYAKAMGFHVHSVDIAERSMIVARALVANSRTTLSRADIVRILAKELPAPGPIENRYVPSVFPLNVARFLDQALAVVSETANEAKANLIKLLAMKVAMAAHPMGQVRKGTAHRLATGELESITPSCVGIYVDAARLTSPDRLWALGERINGGVSQGHGRADRADTVEILPSIESDLAYFDPPYAGTTAYEREYKVVDEIFEGEAKPVSPFSRPGGAAFLDRLFEQAAHIPLWTISFGNAELTLSELEAKAARHGRKTRAIELHYAHKASVARAATRRANREYLVLGVDPAVDLATLGQKSALAGAGGCP
jgi:16S rRNA G966 N2-methylase RsmD